MTKSPSAALINAVLAMDVYNRGVNPTLVVNFSRIGSYELVAGSVTSTADNFEAATYQLSGDPSTRIISFRGTDSLADVPSWLGGAGLAGWPTQFPDAEAYYKTWATSNVSLTGHSLGGGLAGYIAALNDKVAYAYDAMPFEFAAEVRYDQLHGFWGALTSHPVERYSDIHMVSVAGEILQYVRAAAPVLEAPLALLQLGPVAGALAIADAAIGISSEQKTVLGAGTDLGLDPVSLHSIALLTMMQWASDNGAQDWKKAAAVLLAPLQDDAIASAVGIPAAGVSGEGAPSDKMKDMIAYSAVTDASGYGNSAVQALFNGGGVLGNSVTATSAATYLKDGGVEKALAEIVVEYSALLAQNHDEVMSTTPGLIGHEHGILYQDTAKNLLVADLSSDLWSRWDTGSAVDILGKVALIDAVASFDGEDAGLIDLAIGALWGGKTDNLDWLSAALSDAATTVTIDPVSGATIAATDGALLIAGGGNDMLFGTANDDLLIGGLGSDVLQGGAGDNILVGGVGATYVYAPGDGNDVIINGVASLAKPTGTLDFGTAYTADNFWFVKSGNDLEIDILGTHQQVTVADWFLGGSYQLQEIKAGGLEIDTHVSQLVQAMATYAQAHPGFDPTVASQLPTDAQLHDQIAAAWHVNA
ncbi:MULTISPECIES: calcium-binding protein [unclassified Bradyrhizobium]|uniref:calcium-binding protein n=1 Tax=unclassified Bradyrhizobium TaxID=2631580 RepID=UPI0028E6A9A7|nr:MULTISPECIES: calcium-binding protein [unclassified Bradyrhizobium]